MTLSTNNTKNICCVFIEGKNNGCRNVSGFYGRYKFFANVQDRKSVVGIDGGPVIVLTVWRMSKTVKRISKTAYYIHETEVMHYDRDWKLYPKKKIETRLLSAILYCLKRRCW
jgi:chloramphenicol O-acetyltransferase